MWSEATKEISVCIDNSKNNTKSKLLKKDVNRKIRVLRLCDNPALIR